MISGIRNFLIAGGLPIVHTSPLPIMNHPHQPHDDSWESDAVWKLLDQAAPRTAGPRFVDDTLRAARLAGQESPAWWRRLLVNPVAMTGAVAAAAALALAVVSLRQGDPAGPNGSGVGLNTPQDSFAEIQEVTETEALSAAVDQMDDFTDSELVCLIGL